MSAQNIINQQYADADSDQQLTPSRAVYLTVAELKGVDALDLPKLYDVIDPDALDGVARSASTSRTTFEYAGCSVTVTSEEVTVERLE